MSKGDKCTSRNNSAWLGCVEIVAEILDLFYLSTSMHSASIFTSDGARRSSIACRYPPLLCSHAWIELAWQLLVVPQSIFSACHRRFHGWESCIRRVFLCFSRPYKSRPAYLHPFSSHARSIFNAELSKHGLLLPTDLTSLMVLDYHRSRPSTFLGYLWMQRASAASLSQLG